MPKKYTHYTERQFQLAMMRAQWWLASVASGHYKQRRVFKGTTNGPELSDEEKLASAMNIAYRHMEFASECSEALAEEEHEENARRAGWARDDE